MAVLLTTRGLRLTVRFTTRRRVQSSNLPLDVNERVVANAPTEADYWCKTGIPEITQSAFGVEGEQPRILGRSAPQDDRSILLSCLSFPFGILGILRINGLRVFHLCLRRALIQRRAIVRFANCRGGTLKSKRCPRPSDRFARSIWGWRLGRRGRMGSMRWRRATRRWKRTTS